MKIEFNKKFLNRLLGHLYVMFEAFYREKKHKGYNTRVKYMFYSKPDSESLIVSFPGCAVNAARYNYVRSLLPFHCNKLFVLDDFGENHQGCYLVNDCVEACTIELIQQVIAKCESYKKLKNIIFVGSSKGGYCALNFSLHFPSVKLIIGAPQYYIGTYLDKPNTLVNLRFLIGDINEEKKAILDRRLQKKILHPEYLPEVVYFHYSSVEHTYKDHVKDLIDDLKRVNVCVIEDVHQYPTHGGLATYFSPYLVKTLKALQIK